MTIGLRLLYYLNNRMLYGVSELRMGGGGDARANQDDMLWYEDWIFDSDTYGLTERNGQLHSSTTTRLRQLCRTDATRVSQIKDQWTGRERQLRIRCFYTLLPRDATHSVVMPQAPTFRNDRGARFPSSPSTFPAVRTSSPSHLSPFPSSSLPCPPSLLSLPFPFPLHLPLKSN